MRLACHGGALKPCCTRSMQDHQENNVQPLQNRLRVTQEMGELTPDRMKVERVAVDLPHYPAPQSSLRVAEHELSKRMSSYRLEEDEPLTAWRGSPREGVTPCTKKTEDDIFTPVDERLRSKLSLTQGGDIKR
ncbi:hypothetical protein BHM03_00035836 [Ensete ventricosum]|nr:hypothetical protein BHM03_00035836 [Ensete ventricosum]